MPLAPLVMMNELSKMRNASSVRNSTATMIAAFMFGSVTLHSRCHAVAPSTLAASCSSSGTCTRPASRSSEMNGVVFQISDRMMTNSADHGRRTSEVRADPAASEPLVDEAGVDVEGVTARRTPRRR